MSFVKFLRSKTSDLPATIRDGFIYIVRANRSLFVDYDGQRTRLNPPADWNQSNTDDPAYIANKPTTISGYGITNAYTKSEVNNLVENVANTTYTLSQDAEDGHKITLTPSSGSPTTITIPDDNTTYSEATTSSAGLMSSSDKTKLNNISDGAEVNQNAFSNIKVGSTTIAADGKTDTLEFAGNNVTITPDATNDKVTIGLTKSNVTSALGYTPPTENTVYDDTSLKNRVTATESAITTLNGDASTTGSVRKITADAVASIVASAPSDYDTLKEISDWISGHASDASEMNSSISSLSERIGTAETKLSGIQNGAEVNQNAFSNVKVGSTTVSADSKTDTLTLEAGSNVTITPDATNDKVTISATDTNTTYAAGTGVTITGTNNAINVSYGTTSGTACQGNDSRLSDSRPASDVYSWAKASSKPTYTASEVKAVSTEASQGLTDTEKANARANIGAGTSSFNGSYTSLSNKPTLGTAAAKDVPSSGNASTTQVVMGNDSRLSDSRNAKDVYSWAKASTKPSYTASEVGAIATSAKGAASGVAELDSNGKVPSSQLPSYVDDVLEYNGTSSFPTTGETGKIYVDTSTNKTYRWGGSSYAEISPSIAIGETSSTAYRGDRGKIAYDHSQSTHARTDATAVAVSSTNGNIKINGTETTVYTHPGSGTNPHGTTKSDVGLGNVGNFKAVSTSASQGLSSEEQANARANIGAGTSSFSGSYNDLSNKPTIPTLSDATNSTSSTVAASSKAVKTAYDLAASKTANTGTVTKVSTGIGLTGGDITTTGTVKAKLKTETARTIDALSADTSTTKLYPVVADKSGYLAVGVPWTDNDHITSATTSGSGNAVTAISADANGALTVTKGTTFLTSHQDISGKANLASPSFSGTPTAPTAANGTNNTQIATTAFVMNAFTANDAMVFKGTIGSSGATVTALPATHYQGWTYKVITAGTYAGAACEIGDMIICITDGTSANDAHWTVVQSNVDGAVTGPASSVDARVAVFNGTSGKVIKDSGFTIAKSVPSNAVFTDTDTKVTAVGNHYTPSGGTTKSASGGTATNATGSGNAQQVVTGVTIDAAGHVTGVTSKGIYSTDNNTTYSAGTGLSLSGTAFSVKTGYTTSGNNRAVQADSNGNLYVTQKDDNTTYSAGTGLSLSGTTFSVKTGYTTSGNNRAVQADSNGNLYVTQKDDNTDTKNTAGSTDTSSKIFLIGATSQAANPQTYSDNEVYVTNGTLTTKAVQIGGTAATIQYNTTTKSIDFVFA